MTQHLTITADEFAEEVIWLVEGGCTGHELERAFGTTMPTIRRRITRRAAKLRDITPAYPWRRRLLDLDMRLNQLDVAIRAPIAA